MILHVKITDTSGEAKPNAAFSSLELALQILFSAAMNIFVVEKVKPGKICRDVTSRTS
jgi:hypothetical protein